MFVSDWKTPATAAAALAGIATPVQASDPGRMALLAAEVASAAPAPVFHGGGSWWAWALVVAGTLFASFAGAYLGLRQFSIQHVSADGDWREVTYRFRAKGPLKFGTDVVELLHGVVGELEKKTPKSRFGRRRAAKAEPRPVPARRPEPAPRPEPARRPEPAPRAEESPEVAAPVSEASGSLTEEAPRTDRVSTYQRARRLLAEGHDPWAVRELTGLKLAELDLLSAASGEIPATPREATGATS